MGRGMKYTIILTVLLTLVVPAQAGKLCEGYKAGYIAAYQAKTGSSPYNVTCPLDGPNYPKLVQNPRAAQAAAAAIRAKGTAASVSEAGRVSAEMNRKMQEERNAYNMQRYKHEMQMFQQGYELGMMAGSQAGNQ